MLFIVYTVHSGASRRWRGFVLFIQLLVRIVLSYLLHPFCSFSSSTATPSTAAGSARTATEQA
jgi:hypothetical protein